MRPMFNVNGYDRMIERKAKIIRETKGEEAAKKFVAEEWEKIAEGNGTVFGAAALGAAIGSIVPGVGTLLGAYVGAAIGGVKMYNDLD